MKSIVAPARVIFFLTFNFSCFGQSDSLNFDPREPVQYKVLEACATFEVQFGQKILNKPFPNGNLNTMSNINIGSPLSFVGFSFTGGFSVGSTSNYSNRLSIGQLSYSLVIPQKIVLNDTINGKITGYNFSFPLYAGVNLFPKSKLFDLLIDIGIHAGRIRLFGSPAIKQKNPFFSPAISITPRIMIKKFAFHVRCSYDYDITNRNWKKLRVLDAPTILMGKTQFSGLLIFAGIGRIIE